MSTMPPPADEKRLAELELRRLAIKQSELSKELAEVTGQMLEILNMDSGKTASATKKVSRGSLSAAFGV